MVRVVQAVVDKAERVLTTAGICEGCRVEAENQRDRGLMLAQLEVGEKAGCQRNAKNSHLQQVWTRNMTKVLLKLGPSQSREMTQHH